MSARRGLLPAPGFLPLARLARDYFLSRPVAAASVALVLASAAVDLVLPWIVKSAVDLLVAGRSGAFPRVVLAAGGILSLCLLQYAVVAALNRLYNRAIHRGGARLRDDLYSRLQDGAADVLGQRRAGEALTHLITDTQNLQDSCLDMVSELPFDLCVTGGLITAMFLLYPLMALPVSAFLSGSLAYAFFIGRRGWRGHALAMEGAEDLASRFQEGLSAARTVAALGAASSEKALAREASRRYAERMEAAGEVHAAVAPFLGLAEYGGIALVLLVGGWAMLQGRLTAGGLVAFLAYMQMSADPVSRMSRLVPRLQRASASASRLAALLDKPPPADDLPGALRPGFLAGAVSAESVSFRYGSGARPALDGLSFEVRPGESVAVVGPNGSGKSTLLDLLLRLQSPSSGRIRVDGLDLLRLRLDLWRSCVGVVPQDIVLLRRTLAENIALGAEASLEEVQSAARAAGLHDFISSLPRGYETEVSERGASLSGGERQRVAVARIFLRNPRVVLLDEPASALDAGTEAALLPALRALRRGRTAFIVSHRTDLLEGADRLLLLDGGKQLFFGPPAQAWAGFPRYRGYFPASWAREDLSTEAV